MQTQSEAINELMAAMNQAQLVMSKAKKGTVNPFFGKKYADLSTVWDTLEPFREAGIVFTQHPMEGPPGTVTLETQLTHASSGQWIRSRLVMPLAKQDPQAAGSALTYARRYSLGCMTGMVTEHDDDANLASDPGASRNYEKQVPRPMPSPDEIVPPGGSQAPSQRPLWTVPITDWNKKSGIAGKTAPELADAQLAYFLKYYQGKIDKDPTSRYREEWDEAILDLEEEIAKRTDSLVLR